MSDENKQEEKKEVIVPDKFKSLVGEIEKMSVLDLAELVKILEDKFGVSAAAPVAMMAAANGNGAAEAEAPSEVNIELTSAGANKIGVIKVVREITQLGLKDAKDLVDGAPKMIKEGVKKEEAAEIKKKIEEAGGQVAIK
ncbi:MAG: 50S ribosomal protein L7/L12 [bacterium]